MRTRTSRASVGSAAHAVPPPLPLPAPGSPRSLLRGVGGGGINASVADDDGMHEVEDEEEPEIDFAEDAGELGPDDAEDEEDER